MTMATIYVRDETAIMLRQAAKQENRTISGTIEHSLGIKKRNETQKKQTKPTSAKTA